MIREEQIEVATAAYINGRLKNNVPPEEIEEIRLAYQAGIIYADEHPTEEVQRLKEMFKGDPDAYKQGRKDATNNPTGEELLHVLEKGRKIGFQDAVDKAFKWLIERYENQGVVLIDDIHELRDCMEEQQ